MQRFKAIYDRAKDLKSTYHSKMDSIEEEWAKVVWEQRKQELEQEYVKSFADIRNEIDSTLNSIIESANKDAEAYKSSEEYKSAKAEAMDMISRFGDKIDHDTFYSLLEPLVKAKDMTSLNVLEQAYKGNLAVVKAKADATVNTDKYTQVAAYLKDFAKDHKNNVNQNLTCEGIFLRECKEGGEN